MRPFTLRQGALGASIWAPVDYIQSPFEAALFAMLSAGASLTYTVQHTPDDATTNIHSPSSITRSTTTATVTDPGHVLVTGDTIFVTSAGAPFDTLPGFGADVTVVDANTYTYSVANSGATAASPNTRIAYHRVFNHATLAAQTTRKDGLYNYPIAAVRLSVGVYSSGFVELLYLQGITR